MAKTELSAAEIEALALKDADKAKRAELDPNDPLNFNITPGYALPEGFENPPCGEDGHFCVDTEGRYQPDWYAVRINRVRDSDADPVIFPLMGNRYAVPMDVWCDVPPEIVISMTDAVEVDHRSNFDENTVRLGVKVENRTVKRQRFFWHEKKSAQIKE